MTRLERAVFFGVPAAVLAAAYLGICVMTRTIWPWSEVVHEDGVRTLAGTVFYVEHAVRELPLDAVLALAAAGAVRLFFVPLRPPARAAWRTRLAWIAAATMATVLGATALADGPRVLLDNLSQSHTRAGAPLVWGAHWRYHLIERLAQILVAPAIVCLVWLRRGRISTGAPLSSRLFLSALGIFGLLTAAFGWTADPFRDPTYLGHQLRELFTHALVTLPLSIGVCLALSRTPAAGAPSTDRPVWPYAASGLAAFACGAFLLAASVVSDAQSHGLASGLAALLLPHFGEHALGYVMTPALAGAIYLLAAEEWTSDDPDR